MRTTQRDGPVNRSDAPTERLRGTVVHITFRNPENGYCVTKLRPEDRVAPDKLSGEGLVTLVGAMPGLDVGEVIQAEGRWERDRRFGPQLRIDWFKPTLPSGRKGIEVYLASGAMKGIGPVTARRIVETFGEQTFEILDADISRLREVPGIGLKTLENIEREWREARGDRELVTFLGNHGVSPAMAARLRKTYGENALATVRANPYRLITDVRGIGFFRADEIARKIGLPLDAPERIDAALAHVLERQAQEGHTYCPRPKLEEDVVKLVEAQRERVAERLDEAILKQRLIQEEMRGEPAVFLKTLHAAESSLAYRVRELAAAPKRLPKIDVIAVLADFEQRARFRLAAAQRDAVLRLARGGLLILTGGPGTGKTTAVRSAIELFHAGRLGVRLAAPTGRAARRLAETAKLPAETIHRLLNYQAPLGRFGRDAANPIEADLIIIDEASMLDAQLADCLFEAIPPKSCVMLVGDEDQLPSVGPGNVLGDLIASGALPVARLTEVFRQARESLIVTNAHRINRGLAPHLNPPPEVERPDFFFIEREEPKQVTEAIETLVAERIPRKFGLDPSRDVQILAPMRRGELGVEALNRLMKRLLNTSEAPSDPAQADEEVDERADRRWLEPSPGDRVMQTTNNYDKAVFNGDIGHVRSLNAKTGEVLVDYEGRTVGYLRDELDQITLAYAITIHKAQGSEYPAVIIPIHTQHWIMLQRNLLYTALTRARRLVCLVGTRRAMRRAVSNATQAKRFTALKVFLEREKDVAEDPIE